MTNRSRERNGSTNGPTEPNQRPPKGAKTLLMMR